MKIKGILCALVMAIALCGVAFAYPNYQPTGGASGPAASGTYTGNVGIDASQQPTLVNVYVPADPNALPPNPGGRLVFRRDQLDSDLWDIIRVAASRTPPANVVTITVTTVNGNQTVTGASVSHQ